MFNKPQLLKPLAANIPIVNYVTPDAQNSLKKEIEHLKGKQKYSLCEWNIITGVSFIPSAIPLKESFFQSLSNLASEKETSVEMLTSNPSEALTFYMKFLIECRKNKKSCKTILFFANAHLFIGNEAIQQCICNLRELLKSTNSMLVLVSPEEMSYQSGAGIVRGLPPSIKDDILVIEESLPTDEEIVETLDSFLSSFEEDEELYAKMLECRGRAIELLRGFSPFQVEQLISLSLSKNHGLNLTYLQEERNKLISNINGLSLYRGKDSFEDIQGCVNVKQFLKRVISNPERAPKAVVFVDEIEKALAGIQGDLSGVSQDYLGQVLSWMQDKEVAAVLFVGIAGTAKSAIAKTLGNEAKVPSIIFDLGGLKGSLVGESEKNLRKALKLINTLSQERILLIATSNNIDILPPELKRRFNLGTFFFDLPSKQERQAIWGEYINKYNIKLDWSKGEFTEEKGYPFLIELNDTNWTGAEIRNCCDIANRLNCSLEEASKFIVPVYKFDKAKIDALRAKANDKYISASYSGTYKYNKMESPSSADNKEQRPPNIELGE